MSSPIPPSYSPCSGMLAEAVLPPSKEHSYAQWLERTYQPRESRTPLAGKTDSPFPPQTAQPPGVSHSLPICSNGMETVVTCSCMIRNVRSQRRKTTSIAEGSGLPSTSLHGNNPLNTGVIQNELISFVVKRIIWIIWV